RKKRCPQDKKPAWRGALLSMGSIMSIVPAANPLAWQSGSAEPLLLESPAAGAPRRLSTPGPCSRPNGFSSVYGCFRELQEDLFLFFVGTMCRNSGGGGQKEVFLSPRRWATLCRGA